MTPRKGQEAQPVTSATVVEATRSSIAAIRALPGGGHLTPADDGAIAALLVLAQKIDDLADVKAGVSGDGELVEERRRPQQLDNVSMPTFLKFCDALGLTPAGRRALAEKKTGGAAESGGGISGLRGELRGITGGRTA